ncbi:MAG: J domain-containing protein [Kofleriaceae bacterium]
MRCTTWDQVDVFTTRKLRKGKLLSMKVPFEAKQGSPVTLGLELPNQLVVAIDGIVQRASLVEGEQPPRTWIEIELTGLTDEVLARIRTMGAEAKNEAKTHPGGSDNDKTPAPVRRRAPTPVPTAEQLPADERELFQHLSGELRRLRSAAVHDVLGVAVDAEPEQIRASWKKLVRRHHPDLVARRGAPAISHLAEELTILSNRAYDRLRAALVVEGRSTIVGPTLSTPPGWLVGFDDIASGDGSVGPRASLPRLAHVPDATPRPRTTPSIPRSTIQGGEAFEQRARAMLGQGDASNAREVLAAALVVYPKSKALRSLYYVATALVALADGEVMLATSQLETALAHHEQCLEAAQLLEHVRKFGANRNDDMRRVFL